MQRTPILRQQRQKRPFQHQRGISLFVVIVFVLLSMLLALWASRTALFNEMVVGNDADYQRAFEAAQALIQDAELDVRGERANGSACVITNADTCRSGAAITKVPLEEPEVGPMLAALENISAGPRCAHALCAKRTGPQDFWNNSNTGNGITLDQMMTADIGARYGQYTGAEYKTGDKPSNPILTECAAANSQNCRYWIEVLPYNASARNSGLIANLPSNQLALSLVPNVVYRITALAQGRKPGSQVVLQQTYARQKLLD
ncbi:pilus assembly PilX family protein [Paenacidovorax monticola]|uniref:Pilus assembly protein PilX n=1 Tax=Paenacidovorax monticola TaxID=1926868 RepID=A0A7H0HK37_9BURK|nr:PilX N-terminal domain-containing pilus assembly protein [Paenacidovorax monticola]QNP60903.1 pilus assembly protein PilX [Paenacidovorax monticola]